MYTKQQREMDRLRRSSVPHDYDPMYANLSADSRADTAFGMPPSAFPDSDPSINLAGRAEKTQHVEAKQLPNKCICGSYSMSVGRNAPGLQVAPPTEQLKSTDSWGVPVRVGRDGSAKSREKKASRQSFGMAGAHEPHACLMIAHSAPKEPGGTTTGQGGGCFMALSRYNGEYKYMDRNQSGWNITAFNRPTADRYTRSSPDEVRGYEQLAAWGTKILHTKEDADALYEERQDGNFVLPPGTYRWGEYGQWTITIDFHRQVAITYHEELPVPHWKLSKGVAQKDHRRQYGQFYLIDDGGFRIVGRPDKSAVSIMAHGQIYIGLEEARRKGTNRKVVRTDPRISHNKFQPPWEIFEGQHSIGDVKEPGEAPPPLVYCHGKADALTLDSKKAKVKSIARVDKNAGASGQGGANGGLGAVEAARVKAVTAPWHGGAWGDRGGQDSMSSDPTPPGTPSVAWSSDSGGGAAVWQGRGEGQEGDELTQAWQRSL